MLPPPKYPRTMSNAELMFWTALSGLFAAPMIAVLSFLIASPFSS